MPVAPPRQSHKITLVALTMAASAYSLQQTMVIPAIPKFQGDFSATETTATWLLTGFLLASSVATPIVGRLGDMFGKRRALIGTMAVFAVGSIISALAQSMELLIAGRVLQGVAGGVFPLTYGIVRDEFPEDAMTSGVGLLSAIFGIGAGVGLVASGLIVDHLDPAWIFWASLPVTFGALAATWFFVPESPVRVKGRVDWAGAGILSAGLVMVLLAISEGEEWGWTSLKTLGVGIDGLCVLGLFVLYELRVPAPLVDMRMMGQRIVATTNVAALLIGGSLYGGVLILPQFAQVAPDQAGFGFGASVFAAGLFLMPFTIGMLVGAPQSGRVAAQFGQRASLALGGALCGLGFLGIALAHEQRWEVYVGSGLLGIGVGFAFASMATLILSDVRQDQSGIATGMNTIFRTVGGALGGQLCASVISSHSNGLVPDESGYTAAFFILAAFGITSLLASTSLPAERRARAGVPAAAR